MSSELSTSSWVSAPTAARRENFVPFRAWIRVVPNLGTGKRRTMVHNLQKAVRLIQMSVLNAIDDGLLTQEINISTPILFTTQFGDFSARVTIVGFVKVNKPARGPTTDIEIIHSGTDQGEHTDIRNVNRGGMLSEGQDPLPIVESEVAELRDNLVTALSVVTGHPGLINFVPEDVIHIEYNGIKFGVKKCGGRSFS